MTAKSVTFAGTSVFHYDEALAGNGGGAGYNVAAWKELRNLNGSWGP